MMIDADKQLNQLFEEHDQRAILYRGMLPKTDDVSLIVLKGHLIIEEMLFAVAVSHCCVPDEFEKAKLTFAQLLHVVKALVRLPIGSNVWPAMVLLNGLRNSLVHNLEPKELDKKIAALNTLCHSDDEPYPAGYVPPTEPAQIVSAAIAYIMGALSIIGPVSEFIERNRKLLTE